MGKVAKHPISKRVFVEAIEYKTDTVGPATDSSRSFKEMETIKLKDSERIPNKFTGIVEWENGTKFWLKEGKPHREDGPAVEYTNGYKEWWVEGNLHRLDGPAIELTNGTKEWWYKGKCYSEEDFKKEIERRNQSSKPSEATMETLKLKDNERIPNKFTGIVEHSNGSKEWYKEGLFHRTDGPAIELTNGTKEWWVEGKLHRLDGPACEHADGSKEWYKEGLFHRTDGPAIELTNGTKEWWVEGLLHRTGGPAVEYADGTKEWWIEGKLHRLDGPACEHADGSKYWCKEGLFHRTDGPAREWVDGEKHWYKEGKLHRLDGPAREFSNGTKEWWVEGLLHRLDGPAIEWSDGSKEWWIDNKRYSEEDFKKEIERRTQKNINSETNTKTETAVSLTAAATGLKSEGTPVSEEKKMAKSTKEKVFEIAKSDAVEVAKRVAVQQISKTIQTLLIELISSGKKGKQKTALKSNLEEFFSSDAGRAMIKFASGLMLPQLATYAEKYGMLKPQHVMIIQVLSEEMRIQGETDATLQVIDMVTPMLSMLTSGLTSQFGSLFSSFEETVEPVRVALDSGVESNSTHEETFASPAAALKTAVG